ncbi:HCLS1-binding protein 3-like [Gigantopelta aegis]|uniref:HCLS1-binding protein 3-like n=1 Tax=Gigantopelta aegis TaxID=1735272 RepID=UPI001B888EF4|nr:HCLS1-binding protein 3-like [Gigantopelta aegis]
MPLATVTVRELKNKDTAIDLSVPTYKESRGLLGSTVEYHVVVVSSLPFFKSPKHKESDVVQFMISKKFADFEELHTRLNEKYSGTAFPPLPRSVLRVNDVIARERRTELDHFLKMVAVIPKISSSSIIIEFLGVNPLKAGKYRRDGSTIDEKKEDKNVDEETQDGETENTEGQTESSDLNLFDDEATEEDNTAGLFLIEGDNQTADLFTGDTTSSKHSEAVLFEDQDYGAGITEEDEKNLFLPDSIITKKVLVQTTGSEDTSDLFELDDNLDDLMKITISKAKDQESSTDVSTNEDNSFTNPPANEESASNNLPANQNSPSTNISSSHDTVSKPTKPQLPQKPKPAPRSRPPVVTETSGVEKPKPAVRQKPPVNKKPLVAKKPELMENVEVKGADSVDSLNTDDILKYIQTNTENTETDLDLFS